MSSEFFAAYHIHCSTCRKLISPWTRCSPLPGQRARSGRPGQKHLRFCARSKSAYEEASSPTAPPPHPTLQADGSCLIPSIAYLTVLEEYPRRPFKKSPIFGEYSEYKPRHLRHQIMVQVGPQEGPLPAKSWTQVGPFRVGPQEGPSGEIMDSSWAQDSFSVEITVSS